jgi:hypothetical protein
VRARTIVRFRVLTIGRLCGLLVMLASSHSGEKQEAALCGTHCINNLLQAPYFTEQDMAAVAAELHAEEVALMLENGAESSEYLSFLAQDSSHVDEAGNFSVEVIQRCLGRFGLEARRLQSAQAASARENLLAQTGFICNLHSHWLAIRNIRGHWYNVNSLQKDNDGWVSRAIDASGGCSMRGGRDLECASSLAHPRHRCALACIRCDEKCTAQSSMMLRLHAFVPLTHVRTPPLLCGPRSFARPRCRARRRSRTSTSRVCWRNIRRISTRCSCSSETSRRRMPSRM